MYDFPSAKKICSKVEKWLRTLEQTDDIAEYLDQYCMMFNSLKAKISFDELLDNAIHMQTVCLEVDYPNKKKPQQTIKIC